MWPTSEQFDSGLRTSHAIAVTADIYSQGDYVQSLNVTGGTVTLDETAISRRVLSMTCSDVDLDPVTASDLLSPFGFGEIRLQYGVTYTDGTTEQIPCGVYKISSAGRNSVTSDLQVDGNDWATTFNAARFLVPWNTPAGSYIADEIQRIAQSVDKSWTVLDLTGSQTVTARQNFAAQGGRWDAIEQLANAIGAEAVCAPDDHYIILRPVTIVDGSTTVDDAVWTVDAGTDSAVMVDLGTGMTSDNVYNAVVATSSAAGSNPVSAIAYQRSGPLAWKMPFMCPRFYSSPILRTTSDCESAAASILARSVLWTRQLSPQTVGNPALDTGDIVNVILPDGSSELRCVSGKTLPLTPGPMPITTRTAIDYTTTDDASSLT